MHPEGNEVTPFNDLTETLECFIDVAHQAGDILNEYFKSGKAAAFEKKGVDFTTEADRKTDAFIQEQIREKFPNLKFLTEETAPDDYSSFAKVENLVVVDPLDGTTNFAHGNSHFAVSIALVDRGKPRAGVVYIPKEDKLYWAQENIENAYLNNEPIHVSSTSELRKTVVGCDWSWDLSKRDLMHEYIGKLYKHVRAFKGMGSAASDLASLAAWEIDVFCIPGIKPWDIAASALFVEKAGGKITRPDGGDWNVFEPDILATNGILHDRVLKLLNSK